MQLYRSNSGFWLATLFAISVSCCQPFATQAQTVNDHYGLAAGHYERQEYEQAIEGFRDLIENYPSTRQAAISYFFLGESFVQQGDFQSAYPAYEIFIKRLPQDQYASRAKFRMAECAYRVNWDSLAVKLLEDFIKDNPEHKLVDYAVSYLGELRLRRSEPQLALQVFESALRQFADSENAPRNRFGLARSLEALGQNNEAIKFYETLTDDPKNDFFGRAKMRIGVIRFNDNDLETARTHFQTAIQHVGDGHLAEAKFWLAKCEMAAQNFEKALENFVGAVEKVNNDELKVAILFDGAISASKVGKTKVALQWLEQLRKTWPNTAWSDEALQISIELNYQDGNFGQALSDIDKFQKEFSDHEILPLILEYRGRIQYSQKNFKDALSTFAFLIESHVKNDAAFNKIDVWLYLQGLSEMGLLDYSKASETFASIEMLGQDNEFIAAVLLAEASCAVGMNKPKQAIAFFEQYLQTNPTGSSADRARSDLAVAHAQSGSWETCTQMLDSFEENHSDLVMLLDTKLLVGEIALKGKRFKFAEKCFSGLTENSNPRRFIVRGLSGMAWVRMNRGDEKSAVVAFEKIVKEHGESKFAAEAAMACGKYFEQNDQHASAIEMYRHILSEFDDSLFVAVANLRLSYNLVKSGADLQEAEKILDDYLLNETDSLDEAHYQLAWVYQETGRIEESHHLFQQIVKDYPTSAYWTDAVYRVAQKLIADKKFESAAELAAKIDPDSLAPELKNRFHFLNAQLLVDQKRWAEVEKSMLSLLANSDNESLRMKARYWLAESLFQLGNYAKAKSEFIRLANSPELISGNRLAWVHLRHAQCLTHTEDWSDAMDQAIAGKTRFKSFKANYEFDYVIGRCHFAQGRLSEARNSYKEVTESPVGRSTQTAAMAQWRIGETYFHQQEYERAIEAYYRVDSLYAYDKWRAAALVEAGKCQEHLGNWNHAVKLYQQLINRFPDSEFRIAAEKRMNLANRHAQRNENKINK